MYYCNLNVFQKFNQSSQIQARKMYTVSLQRALQCSIEVIYLNFVSVSHVPHALYALPQLKFYNLLIFTLCGGIR